MALLLAFSAGCGDTDPPTRDGDVGMDATPDTAVDTTLDTAPPECTEDAQCDDGVMCTRDICDDRGVCRNPVDPAMCSDGVFCNGTEQCDPLRGCVPGVIESCSDDDVCTIDRCDEEEKICRHSPRDFDEDGEADWHCEGGTDCDDRDPTRASMVAEVCGDGVDNDCDEVTDEAECGRPENDTCEDPLDVSAGGTFTLDTTGASPDYSLECGGAGRRDMVLSFTIDEPKDVDITAEGRSSVYVAVRRDCNDRGTEFECRNGFPGRARMRALEAGTYYVLVLDIGGEVNVEVDIRDATEAPPNSTCENAIDVSEGGRFEGSLVDVSSDYELSCGASLGPDLTYTFTLTEPKDVIVSALSTTRDTVSFALKRGDCEEAREELRCARGAPAGARSYSLRAGTYFLIVDAPSFRELEFILDVAFEDPSSPPPGDTCDNAIPLAIGEVVEGTLADKQDDHALSCGFYYRDAVYSFELTERSDVTVVADGERFMNMSVRQECGAEMGDLRCVRGTPARARVRDLPRGTYFVLIESFSAGAFSLSVETSPPTPSEAVVGNENCETAHVVPETGGLYTGDTSTLANDYGTVLRCGGGATSNDAVFLLPLTSAKRVTATTEGSSFDSVLHLHSEACVSEEEDACDDDGGEGTTSLLTRDLGAGNHYFIVDGFGSSTAGEYTFEVTVEDL